ncbi:MAG: hypothetical protein GY716_12450 [bacterium]|nr:hypothetical protein [bacterium]
MPWISSVVPGSGPSTKSKRASAWQPPPTLGSGHRAGNVERHDRVREQLRAHAVDRATELGEDHQAFRCPGTCAPGTARRCGRAAEHGKPLGKGGEALVDGLQLARRGAQSLLRLGDAGIGHRP